MTRRLVVATCCVFAGCRGGESLPEAAVIEAVAASNAQVGVAGGPLPGPLQVRVLGEDNETVRRAGVRWSVTSGAGATLSDTMTLSDGNGIAEVGFTLGATPGGYVVQAALVDVEDQFTQLTATALPPPVLTGVAPTTFAGGDTLTLTGQDLAQVELVRIGGDAVPILSQNATQIVVRAPVCRPGGPVQVIAYRMRAPSNALQGTFVTGGTVTLQVGQWTVIDPSGLPGCVTFPDAGASGAEYAVTVMSVAADAAVVAQYAFGGDSLVPPPTAAPPRPLTPAEAFHTRLRDWEAQAAQLSRPAMAPSALGAAGIRRPEVGHKRDFRVCSIITCSEDSDFARIRAEARYVGNHAAIYVDLEAPPGGFSQSDFDSLGAMFDERLYDVATTFFGSESDVDENGVVIVLMTPVVNGLTPSGQCQSSIITGFFFGIDIDPAFLNDSRGNRAEVFYTLAPDPNGVEACALSLDLVRRLVPVTFVHEFQHMISYHQHVLLRAGNQEVLWLNEGLSHLSEELAAHRFDALGRADLFSRFAIGNLFNAYLFLSDPDAHVVISTTGTGSLEERGSAWLFLRWLIDQHGEGIVRRLVETGRRGAANVEAVTGEPMSRLLADWFMATWASDLPDFTAPARLKYTTWRLRTTYGSLHDQLPSRFDRPFPIVPTLFAGGQFGTTGTIRSGTGNYYRVVQQAGQAGFSLRLTNPVSEPLLASDRARVTVLRVR
ncbi:MAG: IPT/TIG domain-containing protein [Gemmatimonadales bacterium]